MICNSCNRILEGTNIIPPSADGSSPAFCGFCGSDDLTNTCTCEVCECQTPQKGMASKDICQTCWEELEDYFLLSDQLAQWEEVQSNPAFAMAC
jgi:hypothetical protein